MSIPHEYLNKYDEPELHGKGNTALYEDVEASASCSDANLYGINAVGRGPRGDSYVPEVVTENDNTFIIDFKNDRDPSEHLQSPNLHAGKLSILVNDLPDNTGESQPNIHNTNELIMPTDDNEGQYIHFYITRNNVAKQIAVAKLPKGAHGTQIYTVDSTNILELRDDFTYELPKADLLYNGEHYDEMPEPRIWDIAFANVEAYAPGVTPQVKRRYLGSGVIVAVTETKVIILFKTIYRDSELDDKEDKANKVTHVDEDSTDIQYPSAKCVYNIQEMLKGLIADEQERAEEAEETLQQHIDDEQERAEEAEEDLQDQIINDVTRIILCNELPPISQANPNYIYSIPKANGDESYRNARYEFYKVGNAWEQIGKDLPKHGLEIHLPTGEVLWYDETDGKFYMLLDWETGQEKELTFESTKEDPAITADSFIVSATEGFDVRITE